MQTLFEYSDGDWQALHLPEPDTPLQHLPHLLWESPCHLFSPAFWRHQHWSEIELKPLNQNRCRLGDTLLEETIACVLGGFGLTAESSLAYFSEFKRQGILERVPSNVDVVFRVLQTPIVVNGHPRRYRFWKSKGSYIYDILKKHRKAIEGWESSENCAHELRDKLCTLPGVGLKTASWISRNWLESDRIAVIDIHILRSLEYLGYSMPHTVTLKAYRIAESAFIDLADSLGVSSQTLDLVIWSRMRQLLPQIKTKISELEFDPK